MIKNYRTKEVSRLRVRGEKCEYLVGTRLTKQEQTGIDYLLAKGEDGKKYILGLATEEKFNRRIDESYSRLTILKQEAEDICEFCGGKEYHYDWLFPKIEALISVPDTSGGKARKAIVLDYGVDAGEFLVLNELKEAGKHVDERTSAWIFGRILKFMQLLEISDQYRLIFSSENLLVHPDAHRVTFFDFTNRAIRARDILHEDEKRWSLGVTAKFVLELIGNPETTEYIEFLQLINYRYCKKLGPQDLNVETTHREFYELVHRLFGREFHPFTII